MHSVDAVVVGAGVVGLAVGRRLAGAGLETVVLEANDSFGSETSSRNSEVIHAGIYYAPGSLKARLCRSGRESLYDYCETRSIPHRRSGKIIVATSADQCAALAAILVRANANGVDDLVDLSREQVARLEPELRCTAGLLSPSTGVIDSHAFMVSLLSDLEDRDGRLVCRTRVTHARRLGNGEWAIWIEGEGDPVLRTSYLINCAGLGAHAMAAATDGFPTESLPPLHLARGVYYAHSGTLPFQHLIYPVPVAGGLGIHLTLDLAGGARFGPNVEWVDAVDYALEENPERDAQFYAAARSIFPKVDVSRLSMSFAGIRPKLSGPADPPADFLMLGPEDHGLTNHVAFLGIESPGLTASLALADEVATYIGVIDIERSRSA